MTLNYEKGETKLVQGKGCPQYYIRGGCGTFLVPERARYMLCFGGRAFDIYLLVKARMREVDREKLTNKVRQYIEASLANVDPTTLCDVGEDGNVTWNEAAIELWISSLWA